MELKVVLICCLVAFVVAEDVVEEEDNQETTGLASIGLPGELTFSDGFLRAVSVAGALVTGVAGLAAILSFLLPMVGLRTCALIGTCEPDTTAYSQGIASNSVYDQQGFSGYQYPAGFRKRSLEYVGPILKALSSAYEKYGPAHQRKGAVKTTARK